MKFAALLLALVLTACGGGGGGGGDGGEAVSLVIEPPCTPATIDYVYSSAWVYIEPTTDSCLTPAEIEQLYYQVLTCVGVTNAITAPRIEFVSFTAPQFNPTDLGKYENFTGRTWINKDRITTAKRSRYALSHEFVHHALFFMGASQQDNDGHDSPAFDNCEVYI